MRIKVLFFFPIILVLTVWFSYNQLFQTFYQQDEWMAQGHIFTEGLKAFLPLYSPLSLIGGGGRLLAQPIQYLLYNFFPFQIAPFAVFAIFFHFLNSLFLFFIVKKITKNDLIAIFSSLFFATSSVSMQAVSWIGASVNTLLSAFFVLLSLFLYFEFLENNKKKFLYGSIVSALTSYFFKESSVFIFALLPLTYLIFGKRKLKLLDLIKTHWVILIYGVIAIIARTSDLFLNFRGTASFVIESTHPWQRIMLHLILYPVESFSQSFIYPGFMWNLSSIFLKINYPRLVNSDVFAVIKETISADFISVVLSFIFLVVMLLIYLKLKEYRKLIVFALLFTLLSFLPFVLLDKGNAYLDSRYFYLGVAGAGVLFAIFIENLKDILRKFINLKIASLMIYIFAISYLIIQIQTIRSDIKNQVAVSSQRVKFLSDLDRFLPSLPPKSIIYITGDINFYVPVNKTPLQEGPGFTLMVWYYKRGNVPASLIKQNFLWDINSEGYRETRDGGFGYFYNLPELKKIFNKKNLNKNDIFGFYYKGGEMKLIDITSKVRSEI